MTQPIIDISMPIITDSSAKSVAPLIKVVNKLKKNGAEIAAFSEAERLKPYFKKMDAYVARLSKGPDADPWPKDMSKPGTLSKIFTTLAAKTQNLMLSETVIAPDSLLTARTTRDLYKNPQFTVSFDHYGHKIRFGCLQVLETDSTIFDKLRILKPSSECAPRSSIALSVLYLDHEMMDSAIAEIGQDKLSHLLSALSPVMNEVNHDMLHHMTIPVIIGTVAKQFARSSIHGAINAWSDALPDYEAWAHAAHEKILLGGEDAAAFTAEMTQHVDDYFDRLPGIKNEVCADYFGMVMAHTLTRLYSLDAPIMHRCLERMYESDRNASTIANGVSFEDYVRLRELRAFDNIADDPSYQTPLGKYKIKKYHELFAISREDVRNHTLGNSVVGDNAHETVDADTKQMLNITHKIL